MKFVFGWFSSVCSTVHFSALKFISFLQLWVMKSFLSSSQLGLACILPSSLVLANLTSSLFSCSYRWLWIYWTVEVPVEIHLGVMHLGHFLFLTHYLCLRTFTDGSWAPVSALGKELCQTPVGDTGRRYQVDFPYPPKSWLSEESVSVVNVWVTVSISFADQ